MADLLDDNALRAALTDAPAWTGDTTGIRRTVKAADFLTAVRIVTEVAELAEQRNHHPDIDIRWRTLHFALTTHSAGGVTTADTDLARGIDDIIASHSA